MKKITQEKRMVKVRKIISLFLLITIIVGIFTGCAVEDSKTFKSAEDFEFAKIGVMTGSVFDLLAKEYYPEAKLYHLNLANLILNLKQEKINGALLDNAYFTPLLWEDEALSFIEMDMPMTEYAVAFSKNAESKALVTQINEFIRTQTENGWLAQQEKKWFSESQPDGSLDMSQLTGENGTLRVAATLECIPFAYLQDEQYSGFDADFLFRFAKEYGYALEIDLISFDAILPGLAAEKYDLAIAGITVTKERQESVLFSDVYYKSPAVMAVLNDNDSTSVFKNLVDLENATLGIVTGTSWDLVAQKRFPNAERKYFSNSADVLLALEQGKVDAFFADRTVYSGIRWENSNITAIDEPIEQSSNALIFAKNDYDENLLEQVNEFIAISKDNGTLDRLSAKWFADAEPEEHPDYNRLSGENGTLRIAVCDAHRPVAYQKGTMFTGYEVDFLTLFAEEYGYQLDLQGMAFDALIPSVASGKCDIGACGITITPERAENVTFSDPHIATYGTAIIRSETGSKTNGVPNVETIKDLENGTFAILTGSIWDGVLQELLPSAKMKYFTSMTDMVLALSQGKVDAILGDETFYLNARWEDTPVEMLEETVGTISCGMILAKDSYDAELLEQLNTFIGKARTEGIVDALAKKWLTEVEPAEHPDYTTLTGENGILKIAVENAARPMTYQKNGGFTGFDVELLTMFAKEYGYGLEFTGMSFDALIPTISSGKCDIGVCGIAITEERAQSVTYTDCYTEINGVVIVNQFAEEPVKNSFWEGVTESFHKTFIREDRWKLIAEGIGITMLISTCATILGTLLGFGLYMLSRSDVKLLKALARGVAKVYSRIVAGTPIVVILMILFYVIFGKIRDMNGIVVAILGFTLTFGAFVYDHMTVSVSSVDGGQTEAAYALGYPKNMAFFRIIFPQAMSIFLPSYCGQAVELIKATAVVGYVAVNDLTKVGDIIRSNTYEAFFPLLATALIYFLLTWMLSALLGLVKRHYEPKRRSAETILKGVHNQGFASSI